MYGGHTFRWAAQKATQAQNRQKEKPRKSSLAKGAMKQRDSVT